MAKKLDIDQQEMLNDFNTPMTSQEIATLDEEAGDIPKKRRKRSKRATVRVSAYLSNAQYRMLDELAAQEEESLTSVIGMAIEELWDRRQRQQTAKLSMTRK